MKYWEAKMKVAIIDDEKRYRKKIKSCVESMMANADIKLYESGNDFIESRNGEELVFVDIEMPGIDGFQTITEAKKINPEARFIITTTHTELSRNGYKVDAFRYIDKTMLEDEIKEAIESYKNIRKDNEFVEIQIKGEKCNVPIGTILYFETEKRKVMMTTNKENIICDNNINELYHVLKNYNFYMPFRSSIVNLKYVSSFDNNTIVMSDEHIVNLSRRKYQEFKSKYFEYKFNHANM